MGQQAYQADLGEWMQTLQLDQVEPKLICTSVSSCIGYQPLWAFARNEGNLAYLPGLLWNLETWSFAWYQAGGRFVYKLQLCELLLIHCDQSGNLPLYPPENCPSPFYKFPEYPRDVAWRTHTYQISEFVYFLSAQTEKRIVLWESQKSVSSGVLLSKTSQILKSPSAHNIISCFLGAQDNSAWFPLPPDVSWMPCLPSKQHKPWECPLWERFHLSQEPILGPIIGRPLHTPPPHPGVTSRIILCCMTKGPLQI